MSRMSAVLPSKVLMWTRGKFPVPHKLASIGCLTSVFVQEKPKVMAATAMDDPPDSLSATASPLSEDTTTTTIIAASFDPTLLTEYVADLAVVTLNASREDLRLSLLSYPDTLQKCSRFATDPNNLVVYLRKETGDTSSQIGTRPFFKSWLGC